MSGGTAIKLAMKHTMPYIRLTSANILGSFLIIAKASVEGVE